MQGKVEICGINTAKLEVLKNDEMTELLRRTKQGDMDARERLIRGNLRLVLSVLQRFTSRGENMDDLFQVGCIGLIKAIDNFDITHPVRFSTYGVPMIDEGWIQHIALKDAIGHLTPRERSILMLRFGQGKTQMEVSAEIGISQAQVSRLEKGAIRSIKKEL